jgi:hypothetical protein
MDGDVWLAEDRFWSNRSQKRLRCVVLKLGRIQTAVLYKLGKNVENLLMLLRILRL